MRWNLRFLVGMALFGAAVSVLAQDHGLTFLKPAKADGLRGTTDLEVSAPADTSNVIFYLDGTRLSELTNEYALTTVTKPIWRTAFATEWFPAGSHALKAIAITSHGREEATMQVQFAEAERPYSLDGGWKFAAANTLAVGLMEGATPASVAPSFDDATWKTVAVPNSLDAISTEWMRHEGLLGTYRRTFTVPEGAKGKELYLTSESCFWACRYFVNGTEVGSSSGGYLPRRLRITQALHPGTNALAVIVDSRAATLGTLNKLRYYYWNYSGLLQDIRLDAFAPATIAEFRAQGAADGSLTVLPTSVNTTGQQARVPVTIDVLNAANQAVLHVARELTVPQNGGPLEAFTLQVPHPALWDLEHPNLYRVVMHLKTGHGEQSIEEKTGFRDIKVANGDLLLNGKPVLGLQGFDRHGDFPGLGKTQPDGLADREMKLLHDKGYRIFRPGHYPTTQAELDAADRYGMLVLEEINVTGLTGEQLKSPEILQFAHEQLQRLIARDRSHPSIFGWSIGNENRTDQPGSEVYVKDVIAYGKTLDTTRPFTEVSAQLRNDICYASMDFLAVNIYAGWYTDKLSDVVSELDALAKYAGEDKPMVITEYGAEGVVGRQGLGKGSEYYQALTVDEHNRLLRNRAHFIGKMYWTSTEFVVGPKWDGGNPDPVPPFHTKGLLTYYREPKLGWRVMFSPVEMDELPKIEVDGALPQTQALKVTLRNLKEETVKGHLIVSPPAGVTASITEEPFSLAPHQTIQVELKVTVASKVKKRFGYGTVRAVIDDETEAMPELLQLHFAPQKATAEGPAAK